MSYVMMLLLLVLGLFMMFIVLIQRGRGGGLAGALGGAGGQSAFGTKAGDVFTKITVVVAVLWVVLSGVSGIVLRNSSEGRFSGAVQAADSDESVGITAGETEGDAPPPVPSSAAGSTDDADAAGDANPFDESDSLLEESGSSETTPAESVDN